MSEGDQVRNCDDMQCSFSDDERKELKDLITERGHVKYVKKAIGQWAKYLLAIPPTILGAWVALQTIIQKILETTR
jgi:hypothetical protein